MSTVANHIEHALAALYARADRDGALRMVAQLPFLVSVDGLRVVTFLSMMRGARGERARALGGMLRDACDRHDATTRIIRDAPRDDRMQKDARAVLVEALAAVPDAVGTMLCFTERARATGGPDGDVEGVAAGIDALIAFGGGKCSPAVDALAEAVEAATARARAALDAQARSARDDALSARDRIADIARTVRLISLNARVEAARAGEAGRAFGVIAQEVKALSEQTEEASEAMGEGIGRIMAHLRTG